LAVKMTAQRYWPIRHPEHPLKPRIDGAFFMAEGALALGD
jgi:hypothetical protein